MDDRVDGRWCTIKEFCRISSWQLSENRFRQIIKENCFPYPVKKLYYSSRRFKYVIQLTDPNQLSALRRLREIHLVRQRVKEHTRKVLGHTVICNSKAAIKQWRTVRVNIRGYDYVFIQSSEFLRSLYDYIRNTGKDIPFKKDYKRNTGEDIPSKKKKFGSVFICVPQDVYDELSKIVQKGSCSIGGALHIMIFEFLETPQGKAAALFASTLLHPGLARDRINN
jgi:hypothetical protein